jgi:hypothetical protein
MYLAWDFRRKRDLRSDVVAVAPSVTTISEASSACDRAQLTPRARPTFHRLSTRLTGPTFERCLSRHLPPRMPDVRPGADTPIVRVAAL